MIDISPRGGKNERKTGKKMKLMKLKRSVPVLVLVSASFPSICAAHSGTVLRAAVNYLPIFAPILLGGIAAIRAFVAELLRPCRMRDKEKGGGVSDPRVKMRTPEEKY